VPGADFPDFISGLTQAWAEIRGEIVYCVKPRLPSLGLGLLANYHLGVPLILEVNDSETHVGSPQRGEAQGAEAIVHMRDCNIPDLLNPYSETWSRVMEGYAREMPLIATHN